MTNVRTDTQDVSLPDGAPSSPVKARPGGWRERGWLVIQFAATLVVVGGILLYLVFGGKRTFSPDDQRRASRPEELVQIADARSRSIWVRPETPLDKKLQVATVRAVRLTSPVLPVTGTAMASLRPGNALAQDAWQFATPELLTAFTDWQKAVADIQYQETQLKAIRQLNESRIAAQREVVARMEKLVAAGTDTMKDLVAERTNLIQFEIQGRKDIRDQEEAARLAHRTEATLARQLQQAGLEPTMLRSAAAGGDIVVAEVPERLMERVRLGMTCEVRFYALPNREFIGQVSGISPVISKDRRVLNVQFVVKDPEGAIRPGMYAQIGLGTDPRQALLMPADGVLHVEDKDYALIGATPGTWQIAEVQIGELQGREVEVLAGLMAGQRVLGQGTILLKPMVVRCLQAVDAPSRDAETGRARGGNDR